MTLVHSRRSRTHSVKLKWNSFPRLGNCFDHLYNMLRVLSYNIHKGFNRGNRKFVLPDIRTALRDANPDIVFLQEVQGEHAKHRNRIVNWPKEPQAEYLALDHWPHVSYGPNARYASGHHGNAILSKFPIRYSKNTDISVTKFERRGVLHLQLETPYFKDPLDVFCLHLDFREHGRHQQLNSVEQELVQTVRSKRPFVIGGDFNDWKRRASMALWSLGAREAVRTANGDYAKTYPSFFPLLSLDRIYYRGFEVSGASALRGQPWSQLSDHLPIKAELIPEN